MRQKKLTPLLIFLGIIVIAVLVSGVYKKSGNSKTFTSPSLGITFDYLPNQGNQTISVKEMVNKICVTFDAGDNDCSKGQYVQMFSKKPNDTLTDAIKKQFLSTYSSRDCFVDATYQGVKYPSNFELASISFPKSTDPEAPWWENADKCPPVYTATNGIAYFLQDKNHPGKLLFFSIGQYPIMAGDNVTWNQTVKIQD